jgi:hypothetical protein
VENLHERELIESAFYALHGLCHNPGVEVAIAGASTRKGPP